MNILIIEDEKKMAAALRVMLLGYGREISVIGVLSSVAAAIRWLQTHPEPDLIISDIELSDGLSFEIFSQVILSSPVIFVTAFDQYAIQAFEANGIDYLLKPVDERKLEKAVRKFRNLNTHFINRSGPLDPRLVSFASRMSLEFKRTLLVYAGEKILPVSTAGIDYLYVANGLVSLRTGSLEYTSQHTMDQLETYLNPQEFFRANRQYLINRRVIVNAEHYFNRRLLIRLSCSTPEKVIISKEKASDFLHWLEH